MQKLRKILHLPVSNNQGSALITAVVMAIVIAIGGIGFISITTNNSNNDSKAYENSRALHAGESWALIAYKWLENNSSSWNSTAWSAVQNDFQGRNINGLKVDVNVTFPKTNQALIKANVYTGTTLDSVSFKKRIVITAQRW